MLKIDDPNTIMLEIRDAETKRDEYTSKVAEIIKRTIGSHWRGGMTSEATPENYAWSFLQFALPQLVFDRPGARCQNKGSVGVNVAEWLQAGLNHWCLEKQFAELLTKVAFDMILGFGVTRVHTKATRPGYTPGMDEPSATLPCGQYIRRGDFILDAYCDDFRTARLMGHRFEMDVEDLQTNPLYDVSQVSSIQANEPEKRRDVPWDEKRKPADRRPVCTLYELYIPEHKRILTLLEQGKGNGVIVRNEDYRGPDEGPYTIWGALQVPGDPYPVSPLAGVWDEFNTLNDHAVQGNKEASTYKRLAVVDSNDATTLKSANSGDVIALTAAGQVQMIEVGGMPPQRAEYIGMLRDRLDKALGFSDAQRGQASRSTTATGDRIAQDNADVRIRQLKRRMHQCGSDMLRKVAWYLWYEDTVNFTMSIPDPQTGQPRQAIYMGGVFPGQEDMNFVDVAVEIDMETMTPEDDPIKQKRAQDLLAVTAMIGPAMVQMPHINWSEPIDIFGATIGIRDLSERLINQPMLAAMTGGMMMQPTPPNTNPLMGGKLSDQSMAMQVAPRLGMSPGAPTQGAMMAGAGNVQ